MRRRRVAALAITSLLAVGVIAGCGSSTSSKSAAASSSASASSSAGTAADTYTSVTATGAFGKAPTVAIPAKTGSGALYTKTLIQGSGSKLSTSDSLLGNFALYLWSGKTHKLIGSTYTNGVPTLFTGSLLPGLETALEGQKVGSRVLAVIPPADAFGSTGNSQIGVGPNDTVVFVVDMVKTFANTVGVPGAQTSNGGGALPTVTAGAVGKGPTITIPKTAAPKTLQVKTLVKGTGPVVKKGQYLVVQYTGVNYRTGKVFDSSWSRSEPWATVIGEGQVIKGWDTGLVGQTVGSRVLLVIPPVDGYGKTGSSAAGIKGTDTLVFAIDIISAS
ncbi:MAG TPA: FKBP-type peptidyl-prolyl cis-trans isomerase [Trebonia sp.]|jgi:FKBP-type peptidyl-prolyl cis-trans isomerase